jgi:hypothetical protein
MRAIDWLFVIGILALIGGPLLTLRIIAKQDAERRKGKPLPPPQPYRDDDNDN